MFVGVRVNVTVPALNSAAEGVYAKLKSEVLEVYVPAPPLHIPALVAETIPTK